MCKKLPTVKPQRFISNQMQNNTIILLIPAPLSAIAPAVQILLLPQ
jgi:hypothetical protein